MGQRVVLIEDDLALGQQVVETLRGAGFEAKWLTDPRRFDTDDLLGVDLLVLDLMLPGIPGMEVLRRVRAVSDVPVLVLSARNETAVRVEGLALGADDYLVKPFWPEELVERVRARLRRPALQRSTAVEMGPLRIDLHSRQVSVDGQPVALTSTEYGILSTLARRRASPVSRQALADQLLDDRDGADRTLDVHVSRLRKKLGPAGALVVTVWGIGYRLGKDHGG